MIASLHALFQTKHERNQPLIAVAVGSGRVTRAAVESGADFLLALSAGVYRHQGVGSLASFLANGNANEQTLELLRTHCLPHRGKIPVFAGVLAGDPTTDMEEWWRRLHALGVEGVTNWPAVGFVDGTLGAALEAEGLGVAGEAAMLTAAKKAGFATLGFALSPADASRFVEAGVDGLILDIGLTRSVGDLPQRRDQIQDAVVRLNAMLGAVRGPWTSLCIAFGGPITSPEDLEVLFRQTAIDGFAGGSTFERFPVHESVTATVRGFKSVTRRGTAERSESPPGLGELLGRSLAMKEVFRIIERIAPTEVNVCLSGETGTGKEVVAKLLHRLSPRSGAPFATLNCGAIPDTLLESELFGHEKGAFTGAYRRRLGKFELAHRGTLFLDEIGDLSPHGQVALLRVLQEREIIRVGSEAPQAVEVRIVTATHLDLERLVREGRFRSDLYFRLNEFTITLPAIRERLDDLPILVDAILAQLSVRFGRRLLGLTATFHEKLRSHAWPGNVRELQQVLCRAAILEEASVLTGRAFTPSQGEATEKPKPPAISSRPAAAAEALARSGGNKALAARSLGITRKTLYAWLALDSS
jgi:two-component system response regulator HydG